MSKIFVTGATGFIGKRLILQLLEDGHEVFALSRIRGINIGVNQNSLHMIYGDLKLLENIEKLPSDIDVAYYLVHSMTENIDDLVEYEAMIARNFVKLINCTACRQIIYLGGILEKSSHLSPHLLAREKVEQVLKEAKASLTVLRASIIIGSGSASFEIIRDLVEKVPLMIAPKWVKSLCQPISIADVLFYLSASLLKEEMYNQTYEIGGPEVMSFQEVLIRYASFRNLKRWILQVPVLTPKLSSYWLVFITSVRLSLCSYLVQSMKYNSVCHNCEIQKILPHSCLNLKETFEKAMHKISNHEVVSSWMDAWAIRGDLPDLEKLKNVPVSGCLKNIQKVFLTLPQKYVARRIWAIGGKAGWYGLDWAWHIRGFIDQLFGGTGMNRGRKHPENIDVGDSIDFWRVIKADKENMHLILYAEMKLPGEAWLEFYIKDGFLYQVATFRPNGLLGKLYWYCLWPFHWFIFEKMAKNIAQKKDVASKKDRQPKYKILYSRKSFEIREYEPFWIAEILIPGNRKHAIQEGFRKLAKYIFGENSEQEYLPMQVPVMQQSIENGWNIRFMLPAKKMEKDYPYPKNSNITLHHISFSRVAVLRFSGTPTDEKLEVKTQELREICSDKNLTIIGTPLFAFYDPPWTLPALRRNEIMYILLEQ